MGLLHEIQAAVVDEGRDLGPILLKLRLLASRLGSQPLEEWVKHESEGYPNDAEVPDYRVVPVSYTATFSGPFGSGIKNAPIAPYLIEQFAGADWNNLKMRQSIAEVDSLLGAGKDGGGQLGINASNLILLLQGNVYEGYACNAVKGTISRASLEALRYAVRNRVLELTLKLEALPEATMVELGPPDPKATQNPDVVNQISQQIIYGNVTAISSSGAGAQITLKFGEGDANGLIEYLKKSGIPESDAGEFAEVLATEKPTGKDEPFGSKAQAWISENLKKAAAGTWKAGVSVATEVLKEAALRYYGLK